MIIFDEPTPARLIEQIKPDVLVKGGDWPVEQIIGADFVQSNGGRVIALPLKGSYSTSEIIQSLQPKITSSPSNHTVTDKALDCAEKSLQEHQEVIAHLSGLGMEAVRRCARVLFDSLAAKGKILLCGEVAQLPGHLGRPLEVGDLDPKRWHAREAGDTVHLAELQDLPARR